MSSNKKPSKFIASFKTKAFRAGGYSALASAIIIVIAILLNIAFSSVSTAYTNFDTTQTGIYSISRQTKDMLDSLEKEVNLYYIVSENSETGYVKKLLDKFASRSSKLKTEIINPDIQPDFAKKYTEDPVTDGDIIAVCGEKAQVIHFQDMIEYEAGSYENYLYYLQNGQPTSVYWKGEMLLLKAVDFVTSDKEYAVYFLGDDNSLSTLEALLENMNFITAEIDMSATSVPEDASCVVITGVEDLTDEMLTVLKGYYDKSGSLLINIGENKSENLTKLAEYIGVGFTSATIADGDRKLEIENVLLPHFSGEHAIIAPFSKANYVCMPDSFGIVSKENSNTTVTPILMSSQSAYLSTDAPNDLKFNEFTIGAIVDNAVKGSQCVIFGTDKYVDSEYIDDSRFSNGDLFINAVAYLCDKDSAITIHAKPVTSDATLDFSSFGGAITLVLCFAPAVIAVVAGIIIKLRRRAR